MSELDEKKENSLSLRFWQGAIVLIIIAIMRGVFSNFDDGISGLNLIGLGASLFFLYILFALQATINKNARDMRDL